MAIGEQKQQKQQKQQNHISWSYDDLLRISEFQPKDPTQCA